MDPEPHPTVRSPQDHALEVLEFSGVLGMLRPYLSSALTLPLLERLRPGLAVDEIQRQYALMREARGYLDGGARPRLNHLQDPRAILEKASIEGATCEALEILTVVQVARAATEWRSLFGRTPFAALDALARSLPDVREVVAAIDGKILPDGALDSSASPALARIRRQLEKLQHELTTTLERMVRRLSQDQVLQDAVVAIRNDRYVLPVRSSEKSRVAGIIHGASASGASVFLEPVETVPLNNERAELQDHELVEIQRILAAWTALLGSQRQALEAATHILAELDFAFAKADFARSYQACIPEFTAQKVLQLDQVKHPLLEKTLRAQGRGAVPLTLELAPPHTLVVVSGPNTGGKSAALKTVGAAVLMAQAALPVLAREARLPVFARVLADIGDQQSLEQSLSTFSAHIRTIQEMIECVTGDDLVLLDEIGGSTDPQEGAALAVAIVDYFRRKGSITLVSTHYSRLKAYAAETPQALNAAMDFDEATLTPTYRLLTGLPGKSSGLHIAQRLGLAGEVVTQARALLDPLEAETAALVAALHEKQSLLEQESAALERRKTALKTEHLRLKAEAESARRAKLAELDRRLEESLRELRANWHSALDDVRRQMSAAQAEQAAKRLERQVVRLDRAAREDWNTQVLESAGEPESADQKGIEGTPAVGDLVRMADLSSPGRVLRLLPSNQVEVEAGRLRMKVPLSEVRLVARGGGGNTAPLPAVRAASYKPPAPGATAPSRRSGEQEEDNAPPTAEINVIGKTAEEAQELVDEFFDQAYVNGRFRLRVVHGHGKGILRRTLHDMFTRHPHVDRYYAAAPHEGGAGATIVELKL